MSEFKNEVLHDRIVVKRIDLEVTTGSGIILGEMERDRDTGYGKVVGVGPGKQVDSGGIIPTRVKVGDIICFNERVPVKISFKGEHYHTLRESDAILIVRDEDVAEKPYLTEGKEYENMVKRFN